MSRKVEAEIREEEEEEEAEEEAEEEEEEEEAEEGNGAERLLIGWRRLVDALSSMRPCSYLA